MIYLDTSVLLVFTLARDVEPERFKAVSRLFRFIDQGAIKAVTSFYALHELLVIAITYTEPDWEAGSEFARQALLALLNTRLLYIPIPRREEKILRARLFSSLRDPTDLPHAIAAHVAGCTAIVAYDHHFQAIADIIPYKTPEMIVAELESLPPHP
ncbi:type II toxin-antitoxin system VapC family toxin [Thermoflexus sp.]|uniref:type II toxin-antitoxin system VapC family toxin n=1 Tax=Thermoflexus sp. TaxID=1969742 RepID=UPI002ADD9893|nr:PIN domain-containing protein [Thermoflexus sp.]